MKIMRSYRLNKMLYEELQKVIKKIGVTETSFVEMAIIEKMARIQTKDGK